MIALGIPVAALATAAGAWWIAVAYNLAAIGIAYTTGLMAPSTKSLRLRRSMDPVLSVRVPNRVVVSMENGGTETIRARFRDEPPPRFEATTKEFDIILHPGSEADVSYTLTPYERGGDHFRGTFLRVQCPLGLVEKEVWLNSEQEVRVYPNVHALQEFDFLRQKGKLNQIGIRRARLRGLGSEFESLREYIQGDDYRKIDWKASARRGKLIVRQFEQERNQPILICIDVGRRMLAEVEGVTKLDYVLDSLLMLAQAAMLANDFVGLMVYADVVKRYIPPRKGRNQLGFLIEAIHDLIPEPVESDPACAFGFLASRWKRRSLVVNFTDLEDANDAKALVSAFGPMARRHLAVLARVSDPHLKEVFQKNIDSLDDFYLRASASLFTAENKMADSVLQAAGLHSLEAEPQDLAAALVSFYFEVKERALI